MIEADLFQWSIFFCGFCFWQEFVSDEMLFNLFSGSGWRTRTFIWITFVREKIDLLQFTLPESTDVCMLNVWNKWIVIDAIFPCSNFYLFLFGWLPHYKWLPSKKLFNFCFWEEMLYKGFSSRVRYFANQSALLLWFRLGSNVELYMCRT